MRFAVVPGSVRTGHLHASVPAARAALATKAGYQTAALLFSNESCNHENHHRAPSRHRSNLFGERVFSV